LIGQPVVPGKLDCRLDPDLRLALRGCTWTCIRVSSLEKKKKRNGPSRNTVGLTL
jgi:hypothetical protein